MPTFNNITYALYRIASAIFDDSSMAETRIRYEGGPEKMLEKQIPLLEKQNLTMLSDFVEKYAIRKCKKLKNRSKQQGKGDLRLSLSFCL